MCRVMDVVICDDDPVARQVLADLLSDEGWRVVGVASTAAEALVAVYELQPDILVLDLALAAGRGEDVLDQILQVSPRTRTVVFTAHAEDGHALLRSGAAVVIEKPHFDLLPVTLSAVMSAAPS